MDWPVVVLFGFLGGLVGGMVVDARFWIGFAQEVYRHYPGNHLCKVVGCCR